ncbi:MAG: hypothetical protein EXR99_10340 [Gemmataceae bacterium]|nr:hypothetical protein [Gemmataceae bacterium]
MLDGLIGGKVVVDFTSPFVCLGTLKSADEHFLELANADFHDLRDTQTSRENYIAESVASGIKRNRKKVLISRREVIAISRIEDIAQH